MSKKRKGSIEKFDQAARAHNLTYAEAQRRETMNQVVEPIRAIPAGYRKVGEWKENKEISPSMDESEENAK